MNLAEEFYALAKKDQNCYFVCVDGVVDTTFKNIKRDFPNQLICGGISEQNIVSVASGIALQGKTVFCIMLPVYATTRALEQIRVDMAYNNANVKLIGYKTGIKFNADAGYSHWCLEDIGAIRNMPNVKMLSCATQTNVHDALAQAYQNKGPYYIRLENIHSPFDIYMRSNTHNLNCILKGSDAAIIATGAAVEKACMIAEELTEAHISVGVYNAYSLKPFDEKTVKHLMSLNVPIITMEEQCFNGLSSIVADIIARTGKNYKAALLPIRAEKLEFNKVGNFDYVSNELFDYSNLTDKIYRFIRSYTRSHIVYIKVYKRKKYLIVSKRIFSILPIVSKKISNKKIVHCLFGFIPFLKKSIKKNKIKYYLFGIPVLKVKRKDK